MSLQVSGLIQVFARAPVPGRTKTRLIPALGEASAARLHAAMIRDTLAMLSSQSDHPVQLWCAPDSADPFFVGCERDFRVTLHEQQGEDLGARMAHALQHGLVEHAWVILVGSDCPELQSEDIERAVEMMREGKDAVLGPAADGGYYLIGLRRPFPELFTAMPWGTAQVLEKTRDRLHGAGADWDELAVRQDLDRPEDLRHFPWLQLHN